MWGALLSAWSWLAAHRGVVAIAGCCALFVAAGGLTAKSCYERRAKQEEIERLRNLAAKEAGKAEVREEIADTIGIVTVPALLDAGAAASQRAEDAEAKGKARIKAEANESVDEMLRDLDEAEVWR